MGSISTFIKNKYTVPPLKVRIVIHMAQDYYSFMSNCFFETLVIQVTLVGRYDCLSFELFIYLHITRCPCLASPRRLVVGVGGSRCSPFRLTPPVNSVSATHRGLETKLLPCLIMD